MINERRAVAWGAGAAVVFLFVWQQLQSVRLGYEVERTRKLIVAARARNDYLRLEIERRLSPSEIARAARERLGMRPPLPTDLIVLGHEPPVPPAARPALAAASARARDATRGRLWILAAALGAGESPPGP